MSVTAEIATVTPELAEELLRGNHGNRKVKRDRVVRYVAMMRDGKWKLNGESIVVASSGRLMNGQHRLLAVVESGVAIRTVLVRGVSNDDFDTLDTGVGRSNFDVAGLLGHKNVRHLTTAVAIVTAYDSGTLTTNGWPLIVQAYVRDALSKYPGIDASVAFVRKHANGTVFDSAYIGAAHFMFSRVAPSVADAFIIDLVRGQMLAAEDPVYRVRERIVRDAGSKSKLRKGYLLALIIKAWEARRAERTVKHLRIREEGDAVERFPRISQVQS